MDGKTLEQLRNSLLDRWRRIGKGPRLGGGAPRQPEEAASQAEIIDIAQALEQQGRESSLAEQGRRELAAIERALAKMASGSFGTCEDCGEEIPGRRLQVLPEARLCAGCQALEERQSLRNRSLGAATR